MATNPNADYDHIFDAKKRAFSSYYDEALNKLAKEFQLPEALQTNLSAKRAFGLEKYGERAFQSTFESALSSPVAAHLGDEIVDAFNYALHGYYVANVTLDNERRKVYDSILRQLVVVVEQLHRLHIVLDDGMEKEALEWTAHH